LRGVSPLIITVIIVVIGITIAIAVALWMTDLVGPFMGYERVEVSVKEFSRSERYIGLEITNKGSIPIVLEDIVIKWKETQSIRINKKLNVGETMRVKLNNFRASGEVEILVRTSSDKEFSIKITIPDYQYEYTLP
jgi:hypothetical protein